MHYISSPFGGEKGEGDGAPALLEIALIWDVKEDGDALYSEWQAHSCKGKQLKRLKHKTWEKWRKVCA